MLPATNEFNQEMVSCRFPSKSGFSSAIDWDLTAVDRLTYKTFRTLIDEKCAECSGYLLAAFKEQTSSGKKYHFVDGVIGLQSGFLTERISNIYWFCIYKSPIDNAVHTNFVHRGQVACDNSMTPSFDANILSIISVLSGQKPTASTLYTYASTLFLGRIVEKDPAKGIEALIQCTQMNDPVIKHDAHIVLGQKYAEGIGVEQSEAHALQHFAWAVPFEGTPGAYHSLGKFYCENGQKFKGLKHLEKAVQLGSHSAACTLAFYHKHGQHVDRSWKKCSEYLLQAKNLGSVLAACEFALIGIEKRPADREAYLSYIKTAIQNPETAAIGHYSMHLALKLENILDQTHLEIAAKANYLPAQLLIAQKLEKGLDGFPVMTERAFEYYRSISLKSIEAFYHTARCIRDGIGTEPDYLKGLDQIVRVAKKGHVPAIKDLIDECYEQSHKKPTIPHIQNLLKWVNEYLKVPEPGSEMYVSKLLLFAEKFASTKELQQLLAESYYVLGFSVQLGGQTAKGVQYLEKSCKMGHIISAYTLANLIYKEEISSSPQRVMELLKNPLENKLPSALALFGIILYEGKTGYPNDPKKGFELIQAGAELGFPAPFKHLVNHLLAQGRIQEAHHYIEKGIAAESSFCFFKKAIMLLESNQAHDPEINRIAYQYLKDAESLKFPHAEVPFHLGMCEFRGIGTPHNYVQARLHLERAKKGNEVMVFPYLYKMYTEGLGGPVDYAKAYDILLEANVKGSISAASLLLKLKRNALTGTIILPLPELSFLDFEKSFN